MWSDFEGVKASSEAPSVVPLMMDILSALVPFFQSFSEGMRWLYEGDGLSPKAVVLVFMGDFRCGVLCEA